jgi:hypothetical protein
VFSAAATLFLEWLLSEDEPEDKFEEENELLLEEEELTFLFGFSLD